MMNRHHREQMEETRQSRLAVFNKSVLRLKENIDLESVLQEMVDGARALTNARYALITVLTDTPRDFRVRWTPAQEKFPNRFNASRNAFPKASPYTISGLVPGQRYKVQMRARYEGYSGYWTEIVEASVASAEAGATAADRGISTTAPEETPSINVVNALTVESNQPGQLTVSWDAPDDTELAHLLITSGMSSAEHQQIEEKPEKTKFFASLHKLSEPLIVTNFRNRDPAEDLSGLRLLPAKSFLAAPIRHQGVGIGSISLARESDEPEFNKEEEEILNLFASLAAVAVTNSRRNKEEQQARDRLMAVIDNSPVGVVVFKTLMGVPVSLNREAARIFQSLDPSSLLTLSNLNALTVRATDGSVMPLREFAFTRIRKESDALLAEELVLSVPGGRSKTVLVNASPIHVEHDEDRLVVATIQDMTSHEELEKLRAEFLGMVSHELRSPLTSIKGSAVTLRESLDSLEPSEMAQFVDIIEKQANRMRDLISELLDVARIETGTLSVAPEPQDMVLLVEESRKTLPSRGARDNVSLYLETDLPMVMADKRRTVQVLENLLSNAANYSHELSVIHVSAALCDGHVAITVADEGRGVAPERIPHLFQKFARIGGKEGEREIYGSGLGLAICKGIVEAHGGRIWAESAGLGKGTQFTFTLPIVNKAVGNTARSLSSPSKKSGSSLREPVRILAVDDDPHSLMYLRNVLSGAGYVPITTGSPREVLNIVRSDNPHLVILDLLLPGFDGIELMKRILTTAELPVIFLSAYGSDEVIASALESGAADYMVKPFSPTELVARVRTALRRRLAPAHNVPSEPFVLGDLIFDYAERRVSVSGRPIQLTITEYNLLYALSTSAGRVLTHAELLQQVWKMDHSSDRSVVRTYVGRLRRKLGDSANNPTYIFAEPRVGYRMPKG